MRAEGKARVERRVHVPIATALPGPSCPRAIGAPLSTLDDVQSSAVRNRTSIATMVARHDVLRRLRARVVHDAVRVKARPRNVPAFGPAPFPQ